MWLTQGVIQHLIDPRNKVFGQVLRIGQISDQATFDQISIPAYIPNP